VEASQSAYMPAKRLAALLLAAGQSRRMGAENKLLLEIEKKPIIRHAAEALIQAGLTEIYVVTGHQAEAVRACLAGLNLSFIDNPNYARGQASSVSCGIAGLPEAVSDVLIALGDMPLIEAELISALCQRHSETAFDGAKITLPVYTHPTQPDNLKRGNPVIWSQAYFDELKSLSGDQGGRQILADYPAHIQHLHWPDAQPFEDVDTKEALQIMRHYISKK
jgi:molybdenum cofactor cytidylyltransferase